MTEHDDQRDDQREDRRAAAAFREAFALRAEDAPQDPLEVPQGSRRRTWWVAGAAAAAAAVVAVGVPVVLRGGDDDPAGSSTAGDPTPAVTDLAPGHRWLGYRDVEVQVPDAWPLDHSPGRPDCAALDRSYRGPDHPYVEIDAGFGATVDIGCFPQETPPDLPEEFGVLPFDYWVSHVTLGDPRDDLPDGSWDYRGWTLTRQSVGHVQVTVLAAPDEEGLGADVLASARTVSTDTNGCPVTSEVQAAEFQVPDAAPVPGPGWAGVVAVCQYSRRGDDGPGLIGSRRIGGAAAEELVATIDTAPAGGGPDRPQNCIHDEYGDAALLLRFLPAGERGDVPVPEAYVYYDWCFGNGIVDADGARALTADSCRPLFAEPPVEIWSAQGNVARLCWPPG